MFQRYDPSFRLLCECEINFARCGVDIPRPKPALSEVERAELGRASQAFFPNQPEPFPGLAKAARPGAPSGQIDRMRLRSVLDSGAAGRLRRGMPRRL